MITNASKALGLLRRIPSPCSKEVESRTYQALVRPQLEYAAEAWYRYNITTADRLEHIQRAAARFVHQDNRRTTSVNNLIKFLAGVVVVVVSSFHQSPKLRCLAVLAGAVHHDFTVGFEGQSKRLWVS